MNDNVGKRLSEVCLGRKAELRKEVSVEARHSRESIE